MTGTDDFIKQYGKDCFLDVLTCINNHSSQSTLPEDEEQRLYFSLLLQIDWQCWYYGDGATGITEPQAMEFLKQHKDQIKCPPPSYLGMIVGKYNFLFEDEKK